MHQLEMGSLPRLNVSCIPRVKSLRYLRHGTAILVQKQVSKDGCVSRVAQRREKTWRGRKQKLDWVVALSEGRLANGGRNREGMGIGDSGRLELSS